MVLPYWNNSRKKRHLMRDLDVVWQSVTALTPYARNSRTHSDEQVAQVAASIKEFGWTNPILIDEEGSIIAGHGRLQAAQRLGESNVPTITLTGLTDAQKRAYVIADNKLALNAGWDNEMLAVEIGELIDEGFNLDLTGFGADEIDSLLANGNKIDEGLIEDDEVPELQEDTVSKLGDVWMLGRHRLVCGDSCSSEVIDKLMEGDRADMVFTDPPYKGWRTDLCRDVSARVACHTWLAQCRRVSLVKHDYLGKGLAGSEPQRLPHTI